MPVQRLTERSIKDLRPHPGRQYFAWDTKTKGFGVRVNPRGTKTFVFCYRMAGGRLRWKTLGRAGTVALDKARRLAKADAGSVAGGEDPLKQTDAARGALSVRAVADRWMEDFVSGKRKPATVRNYRQVLDAYILPAIGTLAMADVGQSDAVRLHESLRKTPTQANRALATLSSLLGWSMKGGGRYRPIGPNPCLGIEKYPERKRDRYLAAAEYGRIGKALRQSDLSPAIRTALELCILTGARPVEIASLRRDALDLAGGKLELADSKTGKKTIYLAPSAVRLLKQWPTFVGSPYVFPGTGKKHRGLHLSPSTLTHAWADLRGTIGLDDVRLYDARHSYASIGVSDHGLTLAQIGAQLGHTQPATTARYAHLHDEDRRAHAKQIGRTIAAALRRRSTS